MKYFLVDNGSLRAESVLNLRRIAVELSAATGIEIIPASLLHSSKVDPAELDNEPAANLERRLRWSLEEDWREFTIIPFFFGPTGAILDYLPQRLDSLRQRYGEFSIFRTPFLYLENEHNGDLVQLLASRVRETMRDENIDHPRIALVDHGSPLQSVTAVRNALADDLSAVLGDEINIVSPASMERRPGESYAFNEPLLENLLRQDGWNSATVIVSMLFLSPGRHAGKGGDIDTICAKAREQHPQLRTSMTGLVGTHPEIVSILSRRLEMDRVAL